MSSSSDSLVNLTVPHRLAETEYTVWCQQEGLQFSRGAWIAHHLTTPNFHWQVFEFLPPPCDPENDLLRDFESEDAWRDLAKWRHPKVNLNLLQLALIFEQPNWIEYLWQPAFLQEKDYRDESSQLVNHPLHLIIRVDQPMHFAFLHNIRNELFYEKGFIDLTPLAVLSQTSRPQEVLPYLDTSHKSPVAAGCSSTHLLPTKIGLDTRVVLESIWRKLAYDWEFFYKLESISLVPYNVSGMHCRDLTLAINAVPKLSGRRAQPSTVKLVQDLATGASCGNHPWKMWNFLKLVELPPSLQEEALILLCQCIWTGTHACLHHVEGLKTLFWKCAENPEVAIEKAARFLSSKFLQKAIEDMKKLEKVVLLVGFDNPSPLPSAVLTDTLANRNLKDLCVLAVLKAVQGDTRKVWSLKQLPKLVKTLFHLPFQKLHEELRVGSRG